MHYWISTISRDDVQRCIAGSFAEASDGSESRLQRLGDGDTIVFYSPRAGVRSGDTVQRFTAIADVTGDSAYDCEAAPGVRAWRRDVKFLPCIEASVHPLIEQLDFIRNKASWGVAFRRGFFEIAEGDFRKIAAAMVPTAAGDGLLRDVRVRDVSRVGVERVR